MKKYKSGEVYTRDNNFKYCKKFINIDDAVYPEDDYVSKQGQSTVLSLGKAKHTASGWYYQFLYDNKEIWISDPWCVNFTKLL